MTGAATPRGARATSTAARTAALAAAALAAVLAAPGVAGEADASSAGGERGAEPAAAALDGCDPKVELCALDAAPWIAPQGLRFAGPAEATDSLVLRWRQGDRRGAVAGAVTAIDDDVAIWRARLPARLRDGEATLTVIVSSPRLWTQSSGRVRRASANERLAIRRPGPRRFRAALTLRARADVRAVVAMTLRARYPAEGWRVVRRWRVRHDLRGGGRRAVRLGARRAARICRRYGSCRLIARARVAALGERLAVRRAKRAVPTPPERFAGGLGLVRGATVASGPGRVHRYAVYVERGVKIDRQRFAGQIRRTLFDPRGWGRTGRVAFQQVADPSRAGTRVILASPALVDRLCFPLQTRGQVSCSIGRDVVLNLNRWRYAVPHFRRRGQYRRMLANHEVGHRLGHGHRSCSGAGRRAPVMQQQTYGLQGCRPNAWPLGFEVAATR